MSVHLKQNKSSFYIIYVLCFTMISWQCSSSGSGRSEPSEPIVESDSIPPDWPWRGISITSAKTNKEQINFAYLKSVHVNHVSLAFMPGAHARNYKLNWRETLNEDIQWMHQMLDSCKKYEISAAITYQEFPHDPYAGFNQSTAKFWQDPEMLDSAFNTVMRIVKEYRSRGPELVAFEFFCEPVIKDLPGPATRPQAWPVFAQRIIDEVRKIDKERYLIVNPGPWGNPSGYQTWQALKGDKIIYGTHMYQPHNFTSEQNPAKTKNLKYPGRIGNRDWNKDELRKVFHHVRQFQEEHEALIYVGEFSAVPWSEGYELYLEDCIEVFEEYGFSYSYWNLNGWPMWNVHYDSGFPAEHKGAGISGYDSRKWKVLRKAFENNKTR